jgi:hypothetical protein
MLGILASDLLGNQKSVLISRFNAPRTQPGVLSLLMESKASLYGSDSRFLQANRYRLRSTRLWAKLLDTSCPAALRRRMTLAK